MSITPNAASIGIIGGADGPTAIFVTGSEKSLDVDSIKALLDGVDPAALLPDLNKVFTSLEPVCRIAVLAGPVLILLLGLIYLLLTPKEANYYLGYRCYFGMGSEYAWRYTQRLAGILFTGTGLVLTVAVFVIASRFKYMDMVDMVWKSAACLVVELAAALLLNIIVTLSAALHFDRKGNHRRKKRR